MSALELAVLFHVIYERKSAEFNYVTRQDTRIFDPESPNGKLMLAVCDEILQEDVFVELAQLRNENDNHVSRIKNIVKANVYLVENNDKLKADNAQLRNRIADLEKEAEEHPYHEACPKCFRKRECLEKRVKKLEAERDELRGQNIMLVNENTILKMNAHELEARTTWQPIESAPIGIKFIAMYGNSVGDVYFKDELTKKAYTEEFRLCLWMPLPEPPK
jgi:regulator of replication initiation timing